MILMAIGLLLPAELVRAPAPPLPVAAKPSQAGMLSASRMLPVARAVLRAAAEARAYAAEAARQDAAGGPSDPNSGASGTTPATTSTASATASAASGGHAPAGATDAEGGSTARLPVADYTVQKGDTLSGIAAHFGTDLASLEASNSLNDSSVIRPGQHLVVPTQVGWVYSVAAGDTLGQIALQVGLSTAAIAGANHIDPNAYLQIGQRLWIPHDPPSGAIVASAARSGGGGSTAGSSGSSRTMLWPVRGPITSPFGWRILYGRRDFHDGIDIGVPMRTPVHAAISGRVILAGWDGPFGIAVEIQAGDVVTMYAHNTSLVVKVGEDVRAGQLISYSGMTGNATGPHVHFGVYINGRAVNPMDYLP